MRKHELPLLREDVMRIVLPASICLILVVVVVSLLSHFSSLSCLLIINIVTHIFIEKSSDSNWGNFGSATGANSVYTHGLSLFALCYLISLWWGCFLYKMAIIFPQGYSVLICRLAALAYWFTVLPGGERAQGCSFELQGFYDIGFFLHHKLP